MIRQKKRSMTRDEKRAKVTAFRRDYNLSLGELFRRAFCATHRGSYNKARVARHMESFEHPLGHPPRYLMHFIREARKQRLPKRIGAVRRFAAEQAVMA